MADLSHKDNSELQKAFWRIYRNYLDKAEKKRRWSLRDDIPWDRCNPNLNPALANVVESFCAVELYLPDYIAKIMPLVRPSRGRAWFHANWGYEESKHSLALGDWLLRSGMRTEEQMADLEGLGLPARMEPAAGQPLGMLAYTMIQELATWLNYRNLSPARARKRRRSGPAAR